MLKLSQILSNGGEGMHQKERIDTITQILEKNGFVTVKHLIDELHYSSATVNRDLNYMQNQGIVKRSFGGVELAEEKRTPLYFRYSKMRPIKNKLGKIAAELVKNKDTIFIDCSTTAQYVGKYITDKKELTVITNNLSVASFLSEYNLNSICLGGQIVEPPYMMYSAQTVENARMYSADKFFFSAGGITEDGKICCAESEIHTLLIETMMANSREKILIFDHEKVRQQGNRYLATFDDIDVVITDFRFSKEVKNKYKNTKFIEL